LDWQEQRRLWNLEGYCAREACGGKHSNLVNSANNLLYCRRCAFKIASELVTFTEQQ